MFYFFINLLLITQIASVTKTKNKKQNKLNKKLDSQLLPESSFSSLKCGLTYDKPITFSDGTKTLLPPNSPKDLVFYYSFDYSEVIDESGNGLHPVGNVKPGPSFGGEGASALFSAGSYFYVPNNKVLNTNNFSVTFLIFLVEENLDEGETVCPIIQKWESFSIKLDKNTKKIKINLQNDSGKTISVESKSKIMNKKWYHIALAKSDNELNLFINGILDTKTTIASNEKLQFNEKNLFIGNVPELLQDCRMKFFLDELRFYNSAICTNKVQAEASIILGGIEPNYYKIGCISCSLDEAEKSCEEGYQLCSSIEMYSGGYQIARNLGLLNYDSLIWTKKTLEQKNQYIGKTGFGMCCNIIK